MSKVSVSLHDLNFFYFQQGCSWHWQHLHNFASAINWWETKQNYCGQGGMSDQVEASYRIFRLVVDWMAPRICPPALPALPPRNLEGRLIHTQRRHEERCRSFSDYFEINVQIWMYLRSLYIRRLGIMALLSNFLVLWDFTGVSVWHVDIDGGGSLSWYSNLIFLLKILGGYQWKNHPVIYNNLENEAFCVRSDEDNLNRLVFMKIKSSIEDLFATYVANMNFWTLNTLVKSLI